MAFVPPISYLVSFTLLQGLDGYKIYLSCPAKNMFLTYYLRKAADKRGREMANSSLLPDVWVLRQSVRCASWNVIGFGKG